MKKQSLSLRTYLTLVRPQAAQGDAPSPPRAPRPDGPLVWSHAETAQQARAMGSLCARLLQQRAELSVLTTGARGQAELHDDLPPDSPAEVAAFLTHWSPTLCLWAGQNLRPALLSGAADQQCPLALVGASDQPWHTPAPRWLPDVAPAVLQRFDMIFTEDAAAEWRLSRMGVPRSILRRSGPLSEATLPLDCPRRLHEEMAEALAGRPVWLAARVRRSEVDCILRAHRSAARLAHRLLLILVPADPQDADDIARAASATGFRICDWDADGQPDEHTQILVTQGPDELGLWYRLAPLSFIGGSLAAGLGGHDPLEASALGSAVLYGPHVGGHLTSYTRLIEAGAARIVRDEETLSAAVSQLIAPDRAAAMAHAGWDVVSAGAEMTDRVVEQALDWLDRAGAA
ncbi:3-deoxy-D-manno-octulosonic acid transferase [Thalassococcus sp. BH17M4-6]|uniref:3-deoxy-D-manno-octulosonic acid transferase n=1 Tax=Thalassococcus sp. BH17M4-6 TaxID=3413148 RepID=UPI003BBEB63B